MDKTATETKAPATNFRWLILVTCVATYALIVLGSVVRVTGSGDACPDWPRCRGDLLPPLESDVLIEFSHRLLASLVGFLVLATAVAAWRWQRRAPAVVWGATAAVALVGGQIVLGGVTVLNDLPSSMVMAHLALASALLATLLAIAFASFASEPVGRPSLAGQGGATAFRNLTFVTALATFGLMLTGSYVSGSGAGLAFRDWPLFDGRLLPEGGRLAVIHATHRLAVVAVGLVLLYTMVRAWRLQRRHRPAVLTLTLALTLYTAQVLVGAANIWTLLRPAAGAAHLALAVALWATLVTVALFAHRAAQPATERARTLVAPAPPALAEAPMAPRPEAAPGTVPARGPS
ncbi:MAG: hypothetical protein A2148_09460 [Chloroflexi bacterium RBG_16_68_14]|nr:MAG: hypothetical protein A2148_09460 [Chloroflexi bacterium RBG_16_68_14]